jgi:hypothetical protein
MPGESTTYGRFRRFLEGLGLRYERRPKAAGRPATHVYLDPDGEPLMIFPEYRSGEIVRPHHLLAMRRLLVEKGYVAPEDFTRFLEQRESA